MTIIKTIEEARKKRYGWQNQTKYKVDRCCTEVFGDTVGMSYQCTKKNGQGIAGLYCKQHAVYDPKEVVNDLILFKAYNSNDRTIERVEASRLTDTRYYYWRLIPSDKVMIEDYRSRVENGYGGYVIFEKEKTAIQHIIDRIDRRLKSIAKEKNALEVSKTLLIKRL